MQNILLAIVCTRLWAASGRVGVVIGVVGGTALGLRDALAILAFFGSRISACSPGLCRTPCPCAFSVCRGPPRRDRRRDPRPARSSRLGGSPGVCRTSRGGLRSPRERLLPDEKT